MSPHEDSPSVTDELARRRQERNADGDQPLRERVRDEARRTARRHAAADRARRRSGASTPPQPFGGDGAGAA